MRVAGNQGQGPGHNEAIVGPQSVDFQAAVPDAPPSLLLSTSAPAGKSPKPPAGSLASAQGERRPGSPLPQAAGSSRPMQCPLQPPGGDKTPHSGLGRAARSQLLKGFRVWRTLPFLFYPRATPTPRKKITFAFCRPLL